MILCITKESGLSLRSHKRMLLGSKELRYRQSKLRKVRDSRGCGEGGEWACGASSGFGEQRAWDLLLLVVENSSRYGTRAWWDAFAGDSPLFVQTPLRCSIQALLFNCTYSSINIHTTSAIDVLSICAIRQMLSLIGIHGQSARLWTHQQHVMRADHSAAHIQS